MEERLPNIKPKVKQVFIKVHFLKIGEIDTVKEKYTADIFIQARWREKQLDYKNECVLDLDSFWDPKLVVQNLIDQTKDDKPWKEVQYTNKKKAYIVEKRRLRGNFSEKLELADFPFDAQYLNVYVTSEYSQSQLEILEDNSEISLLNSACFVDEQEWALCDFVTLRKKSNRKDFSQTKRVTFPGISAGCCAVRRWKFFVWNMVLIMGLISSASIATFAVSNDLPQNRLGLSITLMLTTVAFRIVTNQSLPKISYNTILDVYVLFCMIFTYTVCIWHAVISRFDGESYQGDLDLYFFIALVSFFCLFHIIYIVFIIIKIFMRNKLIQRSVSQYEEHSVKLFGEEWKHKRSSKKNALRDHQTAGSYQLESSLDNDLTTDVTDSQTSFRKHPSGFIILRSDVNARYKMQPEVYRELNGRFFNKRLPVQDDSIWKNNDRSLKRKIKSTEDNSEKIMKTFISDMKKLINKNRKMIRNRMSKERERLVDTVLDRRIYGINDFVNDFVKIVS